MSTVPPSPTRPAEARRATRKPLRTLGQIVDASNGQRLDCTVLDLSSSGAKLKLIAPPRGRFEPAVSVPATFRLEIERDNIAMDCRLAWEADGSVGAAFVSGFRPLRAAPVPRAAPARSLGRRTP